MSSPDHKIISDLPKSRVEEIIARIKRHGNLKTDTDVAIELHVDKSTVSNWKRSESIPYEKIHAYGLREQLSLEWLINGKGPVYIKDMVAEPGAIYEVQTNQDVIYDIAAGVIEYITKNNITLPRDKVHNIIKLLHRDAIAHDIKEIPDSRIKEIVELAM